MTEKLYPESVVKELLNELRESILKATDEIPDSDWSALDIKRTILNAPTPELKGGIDVNELVRKIKIHVETTEDCMENFNIPEYVKKLLEGDNKLFRYIINSLNPTIEKEDTE
jgi:hypothetical protein